MAGLLLNINYTLFLLVASPWLIWRFFAKGKNKRGWHHKLWGRVRPRQSQSNCIWLHAVSVGEVNLLVPVLRELRQQNPNIEFVISTTTETGFNLAQKRFPDTYTFFCPFDLTWAIKNTIARLRPNMLVLAELEVWPNLINLCQKKEIPVVVINGRLSEKSFRGYQKVRWLIQGTFKRISLIGTQNETYRNRFISLGCNPEQVTVTGNVKFDGLEMNRDNPTTQKLSNLIELKPDVPVLVAGSTQLEEDILAVNAFQELATKFPALRLLLAPRHPERCAALAKQIDQLGLPCILRSEIPASNNEADIQARQSLFQSQHIKHKDGTAEIHPIVIVDVIGELGAWWGCASAAYVGGSLGKRGGQNMMEPAAFGIPVSFGPNTENFKDIVRELLENDAARVIVDKFGLKQFVDQSLRDTVWANGLGQRAKSTVVHHQGASQRTAKLLCEVLKNHINPLTHSSSQKPKQAA